VDKSELSRRGFVGAAAAAGLVGVGAVGAADDEVSSFKNNVPDPLLAGKELPTFKFELEKSTGKVIGNSFAKEATVEQLPISKGIAGVSMRLEPGAIRELHWHATAAEWAYVIEGRCRTTLIDAQEGSETNDFDPGDIWYFPRGHGHSIQCLGRQPCHFILVFDNGYFSEFGTFSITDWVGHTPRSLLSKNLGLPESAFEGFPVDEVYFARGPVPPDEQQPPLRGKLKSPPEPRKFRMLDQEPHSVHKGGREWRVGADLFPISKTITGVILDLEPGGLRELHWHPTADEWQYLISGQVYVSLFGSHGRYRTETLNPGDVGYIPQGYGHSIENASDGKPARILIAFNTGHYEAIDLSTWLAGNPSYLLAAHFGKPKELVERFPRDQVFIAPREGRRPGDREAR
jgi:oxalate decarboxylase